MPPVRRASSRASGHILVVEDREPLRRMLERALEGEGYTVESAANAEEAMDRLRRPENLGLVLTDLKLPGASGIEVLRSALRHRPGLPVVVLTAYGTVATAVEAMKLGAYDFLEKPVDMDALFSLVAAAVGEEDPHRFCLEPPGAPPVVGRHPKMRAAAKLLERVASTDSTVLLTGESGTGKELFARALHTLSARSKGPFVAVNCAAIPESLLENELFGHEKGAFTGADRRQPGRFELAQGGTLLLDEIGELPVGVQAKVLRVLEERTFERVGGGASLKADVRLVAATNRDLAAMSKSGDFRSDLYYRLAIFPIELPPLRERPSDLPLLVRHLLEEIGRRLQRKPLVATEDVLALLGEQAWPGNVRELANVLERATILADEPTLRAAHLQPLLNPLGSTGERETIRRALVASQGDKHRAAEMLGVSYRTLQRRIKEHGLEGVPHYRDG